MDRKIRKEIEESNRRVRKELESNRRQQEAIDNCQHRYIYCIQDAHTREDCWYCGDVCGQFLGYEQPTGKVVFPKSGIYWDEH